jgi:hypothetical protein
MARKRTLAVTALVIVGVIGAGAIGLMLTGVYEFSLRDLAAPVQVQEDVVPDAVPLTDEQLDRFYHLSQGSQVMPYEWFINLEQGDSTAKLIDDEFMSRFRFIPSRRSAENPDKLQIGFAKDDPDPLTGQVHMGVTCAACHVGQITYKGQSLLVRGGPGMIDFDRFVVALYSSLAITANSPIKADRFARAVLKDKFSVANAAKLWVEVQAFIERSAADKAQEALSNRRRKEQNTEGGFGRIDALGAGGNRLYRMLGKENLRALNAPVKALPLWNAHEYDWVQTNGSIRSPLHRNVIEALAVNASLVFPGDPAKGDQFISSARLKNMVELEELMKSFVIPRWPDHMFGALDQARVTRGEAIYAAQCASCHAPRRERTPLAADEVAVRQNKRYIMIPLYPVDEVGTDPTDARNFATRTLDASRIGMRTDEPGASVIGLVLNGIVQRGLTDAGLTQQQKDEWIGNRANLLRACEAYPARPLAGYWAAGPFLHNGSVPTMYDLLLPASERPREFYTGNLEFDPVRVGRVSTPFQGAFKFDTRLPGNSNAGHEYGTTLTHEERLDLLEFLKQLPTPGDDLPEVDPVAGCPPAKLASR